MVLDLLRLHLLTKLLTSYLSPSLAGFADNLFSFISDTFTLVRFWWTESSDHCRDLPYFLSVNTLDLDFGRSVRLNFYALWYIKLNRIGISKIQYQFFALNLSSVPNTHDLKVSFKT